MDSVECKGFVIPCIEFRNNHSIWIYKWNENPVNNQNLTEVWLFYPDGRRVCFIDPQMGTDFFKTYHSFDEVIGAKIKIHQEKNLITIVIDNTITIVIRTGFSFLFSMINRFLLKHNKETGKTEKGKRYENVPLKLIRILDASVKLNSENWGKMKKRNKEIRVGDAKSSIKPIVSHCILRLEP